MAIIVYKMAVHSWLCVKHDWSL